MSIFKYFPGRKFSYILIAILTIHLTNNIESLPLSAAIAFCIGAIYAASIIFGSYLLYLIDCYRFRKSSSRQQRDNG
jgi:hypothetical protein